jgi:hypothetical protein
MIDANRLGFGERVGEWNCGSKLNDLSNWRAMLNNCWTISHACQTHVLRATVERRDSLGELEYGEGFGGHLYSLDIVHFCGSRIMAGRKQDRMDQTVNDNGLFISQGHFRADKDTPADLISEVLKSIQRQSNNVILGAPSPPTGSLNIQGRTCFKALKTLLEGPPIYRGGSSLGQPSYGGSGTAGGNYGNTSNYLQTNRSNWATPGNYQPNSDSHPFPDSLWSNTQSTSSLFTDMGDRDAMAMRQRGINAQFLARQQPNPYRQPYSPDGLGAQVGGNGGWSGGVGGVNQNPYGGQNSYGGNPYNQPPRSDLSSRASSLPSRCMRTIVGGRIINMYRVRMSMGESMVRALSR